MMGTFGVGPFESLTCIPLFLSLLSLLPQHLIFISFLTNYGYRPLINSQ